MELLHTYCKNAYNYNHTIKDPKSGYGSMTPEQVLHTMRGVLEGLHYLHTTTKICHGGLSTSNVLITKVAARKVSTWKVCLCDYNLRSLGIESHSHKLRYLPPTTSIQNTPRGDLYSCSIMLWSCTRETTPLRERNG